MALYKKEAFGTDGFVILTEGRVPGHLTRLDAKGAFPREYAALFTAAPDLLEACGLAEKLIDDMARFVGQMSLKDYALFNEAPMALRAAIAKATGAA